MFVFVPFLYSQSLKCKDSKHGGQDMILLNWLFQDELLFEPVAEALASIVTRKHDRYLLFGWCVLLRSLVECDSSVRQSMLGGEFQFSICVSFNCRSHTNTHWSRKIEYIFFKLSCVLMCFFFLVKLTCLSQE